MKDLKKLKFGQLTVIGKGKIVKYPSQTTHYWLCKCDCGETKEIKRTHLISGKTISCGCVARKMASERMRLIKTHGLSQVPEASNYYSMMNRVLGSDEYHKKYYSNVKICERWLGENGLKNFIEDMGKKPSPDYSIDRVNPFGDYEPSNCRWATRTEQMRNTRRQEHRWY